ncbi:MAG: acyltransferase family protein [Candidatus Nanopelagicaceae bacterium]|jgi:peptidoglycan/LPS O-acetylase OafA/YrhL|nr:acyltransferase [Actinomycetota bacterium]NCV43313.1 acyltransferase [Actinomycetota bacterium]NCV83560.1 acyltransferase [Actinomycetota bacterium]NCV95372.1 acyltransferase [Actinomycetota bacterium]NCW46701.1 acyltransferase [Actinomycetota bacterium]
MSTSSNRYIHSVDGLRAVAVIAVLLYHLGIDWIPGGFLGVDLFFVISGYVITGLILDSIEKSGGLDLRAFYLSRIRRLVPALIAMVVLTTLYIGVYAPETVRRFLNDLPYVFTGTMNWALVNREQDYFETIGRPPLLQHTWSLAVEAQFYLVWPLVLLFVLRYFGKKNISFVALAIALASGIALFLYSVQIDIKESAVSHVYFGTDTHSIGLFLGAALAVSWKPQNLTKEITKRAQDFVDLIGVFGFLGLLSAFLFINESDPTLYRIAFPLTALFGCATLISVIHPASRFAPILSTRPALWIGERSYGIYLWHWIVFQLTRPSIDLVGDDWALYSLRVLIVFALADISYRYIETPIRRGYFELWFRGMKYRTPSVRIRQKLSALLAVLVTLFATSLVSISAIERADELKAQELAAQDAASSANTEDDVVTDSATPGLWVTGDSVILGIRNVLASYERIELINARVGRQIGELIEVARTDQKFVADSPVVLNLGNNNRLLESDVVELFEIVKDQPRVIVVNTAVPRSWRDENNAIIAQVTSRYPNTTLIDWQKLSEGHPEYFASDGVHLNPPGVNAYVSAILEVLKNS